jgi:hypothetical protein
MKNIHLIPTDKPSISGKLIYGINIDQEQNSLKPQHIYITSDEFIEEGDYYITTFHNGVFKADSDTIRIMDFYNKSSETTYINTHFKIILTTDQDLINDGVQAIDDDFLEWFVNNASCEFVEVEKGYLGMCGFVKSSEPISKDKLHYKIIIPQEEPKQECGYCKQPISKYGCACGKQIEEPKQETLEEAAKEFYPLTTTDLICSPKLVRDAFIEGAEWQAERMYSEEEVLDILFKHTEDMLKGIRLTLTEWFKQHKKK